MYKTASRNMQRRCEQNFKEKKPLERKQPIDFAASGEAHKWERKRPQTKEAKEIIKQQQIRKQIRAIRKGRARVKIS
jgi:hypothetical protein